MTSDEIARLEALLGEMNGHLAQLRHAVRIEPDRLTNFLLAQLLRSEDPRSLRRHHGQVYSQNGEDGMIAEILRRLGGPRSRVFVEIGSSDGIESNTRLWLERGWRGLWIEGFAEKAATAAAVFNSYVAAGRLQIMKETSTPENVAELVAAAGLPDEVDLLSIDIDLHTHWVWEALPLRARVHCIEYNGSIPPSLDMCVPYDPAAEWDGSNFMGAGLKTLERLGRAKELNLVGCDVTGLNAFFVAASECGQEFLAPFTAEAHYEAPKYGRFDRVGHPSSQVARQWLVR